MSQSVGYEVSGQSCMSQSVAGSPASKPRRKWRTMGRSSSHKFIPGNLELSKRLPLEKTLEDETMIRECFLSNPRFGELSPDRIDMLVQVAWKEVLPPGWIIMSEGSLHNNVFYVVGSGQLEITAHEPFEVVTRNENFYLERPEKASRLPEVDKARELTVRTVGRRTTIGDSSMMTCSARWAKVMALEQSDMWVISASDFHIVRMQATDQPIEKYPEDKELITKALGVNIHMQANAVLSQNHVMQLLPLVRQVILEQDEVFMKEGDLKSEVFYIVSEGSIQVSSSKPFEVVVKNGASYIDQGRSAQSPSNDKQVMGRGGVIGLRSMLYCAPRVITCKALEKSMLWSIDRLSFQTVQMNAVEDELKNRVKHLDKLKILDSFDTEDKHKVAGAMETIRLTQGEAIYNQGDVGTTFYVLYEGSVSSIVDGNKIETFEANSKSGVVHFFGEQALDGTGQCCRETIQVTSATANVLMLENEELQKVWDRLLNIETAPVIQRNRTAFVKENPKGDELALCNLNILECLGKVEFLGTVELCVHKYTKAVYALKTLSKALVVQRGFRKGVMRERMLWGELMHPFIIRLIATFNEPESLCFLLEAATGGELSTVYEDKKLYGSVEHTKYYTAGVCLAISHLHKRRIVYRNLKPRNVLLSKYGRPKLADMSLAKLVVGHTFTTCGTPTYMAPEIISAVGHTRAVDWWSFGVLLFELMVGQSPFDAELPMEVYSKVFAGVEGVAFPKACAGAAEDLIRLLLLPIPVDRLAMRKGGTQNVKNHAWFAGLNWDAMRSETLPPPYVPPEDGTPHFSTQHEPLPLPVQFEDDLSEWDEGF